MGITVKRCLFITEIVVVQTCLCFSVPLTLISGTFRIQNNGATLPDLSGTATNPDGVARTYSKSHTDCALQCLEMFPPCTSFVFDPETNDCTLAMCPVDIASLAQSGKNSLYSACHLTEGFNVYFYNTTVACMKLFGWDQTLSHSDARTKCADLQATLPSCRTMDRLVMLKTPPLIRGIHIGMRELQDFVYTWDDDGSIAIPRVVGKWPSQVSTEVMPGFWAEGQPDNHVYENCVDLGYFRSLSWFLNDGSCGNTGPFACERILYFTFPTIE